ncbi:S8 family peptidase [uncultured Maricaulis sp.]|uniref:S8 family peptidase n=1 Tax=uncultured Maricaulis sp. TaxID=174710 RepID=UPI0030DAD485|tara:strand:+ start:16488 stop:19430 length:2943 start_codon:yes stop_codon:yes gene_type:complete
MKNFWRNGVAVSVLVLALAAGPAEAGNGNSGKPPKRDPAPVSDPAPSPAPADTTTPANDGSGALILPFRGDIDPFHGDIDPFNGDINPFRGDINPFYGDISPFWGDISPFWGDIDPFSGDISPFWGDIDPFHGDINPFWGDIAPFWGDIGPFWGDINAFWSSIDPGAPGSSSDYNRLHRALDTMFARADQVFGDAVRAETGQNFNSGFLRNLLAEFNINPADRDSLATVTAETRSRFFLAFYDGLMAYSGTDRVDHWMASINWTPALSQAARGGEGAKVTMIDFGFASDEAAEAANVHVRNGVGTSSFYHGAAVASLINGAHDGVGVMGIAPDANVSLYNPFDDSNSTDWASLTDGVTRMVRGHPDVMNLSLGVSGWVLHPEWNNVFGDKTINRMGQDTLFVMAAGNDGISQTTDVAFDLTNLFGNLLLVGSVDPNNQISSFSNRPGTACVTTGGQCSEGQRLMDRFLVAPGELILVSDGMGGTMRVSGTSFAAPLVTGAAALIVSEWEWLGAQNVGDILLLSARDLGAPGVDEVYGHGLLDVTAAMSPLNRDNLYYIDSEGSHVRVGEMGIVAGQLSFAHSDAARLTVFEDLNDTYRDFEVSLDNVTRDSSAARSSSEANAKVFLIDRTLSTDFNFSDTGEMAFLASRTGNLEVSIVGSRLDPRESTTNSDLPFQAGVQVTDTSTGREYRLGIGEGALALNDQSGFGLFSDHRPETGGVNPVLGFASGGAYAMSSFALGKDTQFSVGLTSTRDEHIFVMPGTGEEQPLIAGLSPYEAVAMHTGISQAINEDLTVHASYTQLYEMTGLLGAQGTGTLGFEGGTQTSAVTLGADANLAFGLSLSASATMARTHGTAFNGSALSLKDGANSTAFQITARRDGIFTDADGVRVSLIQPLHLESGAIEYTSGRVINRETGEIGIVTDRWKLGGERPLQFEVLYATGFMDGRADISLFSRAELSGSDASNGATGLASGASFRLKF